MPVGRNMLGAFGHHFAMCCDMLGVVRSSLKIAKFEPKTPNASQHVATHRNTVAKRTQHVAPNNATICCVGRLAGALLSLLSVFIYIKLLIHHLSNCEQAHGTRNLHIPWYLPNLKSSYDT